MSVYSPTSASRARFDLFKPSANVTPASTYNRIETFHLCNVMECIKSHVNVVKYAVRKFLSMLTKTLAIWNKSLIRKFQTADMEKGS